MTKDSVFGVLCLQGGYANHLDMMKSIGLHVREVRYPEDLSGLSGIILPGGESTTMGMLLERHGLFVPLRDAILGGLPAFGTCAGAILLAKDIADSDQPRFGAIDITVDRNAYGSQVDSFETTVRFFVPVEKIETDVEAVFIRAPKFMRIGSGVSVLAEHGGLPVLVRQDRILVCAFHPELTSDPTIHRYFADFALGT